MPNLDLMVQPAARNLISEAGSTAQAKEARSERGILTDGDRDLAVRELDKHINSPLAGNLSPPSNSTLDPSSLESKLSTAFVGDDFSRLFGQIEEVAKLAVQALSKERQAQAVEAANAMLAKIGALVAAAQTIRTSADKQMAASVSSAATSIAGAAAQVGAVSLAGASNLKAKGLREESLTHKDAANGAARLKMKAEHELGQLSNPDHPGNAELLPRDMLQMRKDQQSHLEQHTEEQHRYEMDHAKASHAADHYLNIAQSRNTAGNAIGGSGGSTGKTAEAIQEKDAKYEAAKGDDEKAQSEAYDNENSQAIKMREAAKEVMQAAMNLFGEVGKHSSNPV